MTTITTQPSTEPLSPSRRMIRQLGIDTAYAVIGFPLGTVAFVVMITGISMGAGLLITLLGIPVLVATIFFARGFAHLERARIRPVLRRELVPVVYKRPPADAGRWRRMFTPLADGQAWLDVLHGIIRFPLSIFAFVVTVTWWAVAAGGLTYWFWQHWLPAGNNDDLPAILGFGDSANGRIVFYLVMGLFTALTLPLVIRAVALAEAWVAHAMLNAVAGLRNEISGLTVREQTAQSQRAAAMSAEATALHRLERDIHDGPQQRLVRLAVDLGRARQQLDGADAEAARVTVDEALSQTRETLDELRTLSRGIAPPILTDRGLPAAVAALAARASIPVDLDIPADLGRLHPLAEQTTYFVIAEALTNVAKHSGATRGQVSVRVTGDRLEATVTDDGAGGAQLAKGHGLAGLADRVHAAGGDLWVSSPDGGPTKIRVELPCPTVP